MKNIIVDYSNVMHRCIHASESVLQNLMKSMDDFSTDDNSIYKIYKRLVFVEIMSFVEKFSPDRIIIAIDSKNVWRKSIYPEYKAHRQKQRDDSAIDFDEFFPIANAYLEELKTLLSSFYFIQVDKTEADDIIAILARKFEKNNEDVVVVSTDSDLDQLCSSNISRYSPTKREFINVDDPKKELALKLIYGDSGSDNIPNILFLDPTKYPVDKKIGVGPVLAEKILKEEDFIASKMVIDKVQKKYTNLSTITIKEEVKKNYDRNVALIDLSRIPFEYEQAILDCYANYKVSPINLMELNRFATRIGANEFVEKFYVYQNVLKNLNKTEESDDLVS